MTLFSFCYTKKWLLNTDKARVQSGSHLWRQALALFRQAERDVMEKANNTSGGGVPTWRGWLDFNQRQSFSYSHCLLPSSARRLYVRAYQIQRRDITSPLRFESFFDFFLFCYLQLSISMRLYHHNNNNVPPRPSRWLHLPEEAHSKQLYETLMTLVQALDVQYFFFSRLQPMLYELIFHP